MKAKKVNIYLNPENPLHKGVLDYLAGSNLSTTEAIVVAVSSYQQGQRSEGFLIEAIRQTIQECLSGQRILAPPTQDSLQPVPEEVNEEAVADFLSFFKQ